MASGTGAGAPSPSGAPMAGKPVPFVGAAAGRQGPLGGVAVVVLITAVGVGFGNWI